MPAETRHPLDVERIVTTFAHDLIALKQALGRPKDLRVAVELDELRRLRDGS